MTTFAEDVSSAWHSRPIEFYDVVFSTGETFLIASGNRDLQVGSKIYKATPLERSELSSPNIDGSSKDVEISIPVDHAIVSRWLRFGGPPSQTLVTCWQKQERSQLIEQQWVGLCTAITCSGNIAKLSVPARVANNVTRYLPTVTTSLSCPYILYDKMCTVDPEAFKVATTALLVNGREVRVDMGDAAKVGLVPGWSGLGMLKAVTSGERRTILAQNDEDPANSTIAIIVMEQPIPDLRTGDAVEVFAGCAHDIQTCKNKFNVVQRFGGYPYAPVINPFVPGSSGLDEDT